MIEKQYEYDLNKSQIQEASKGEDEKIEKLKSRFEQRNLGIHSRELPISLKMQVLQIKADKKFDPLEIIAKLIDT